MVVHFVSSVLLTVFFYQTSAAIKCYHCNSANNSACLDLHLQKLNTVVPIVDCAKSLPSSISQEFFCRKITQTILYADRSPEVRITRGCAWVKSKKECYRSDNKDHLETVCQCFGDMCNGATTLRTVKLTVMVVLATIFISFRT